MSTSKAVGVTPEKAVELVKKGKMGAIVAFKYWLNTPDAEVNPENLGIPVHASMLTISPSHTPSIKIVDDILVCEAFFSEDVLPDEVKVDKNVVGEVEGLKIYKVSVRIPFNNIVGIFFPKKDVE